MFHAERSSPSQSPPRSPGCQETSPPRPRKSRKDAQAALCRQVPQVLLTSTCPAYPLPPPPELAAPTPVPPAPSPRGSLCGRKAMGPQRQCASAAEAIVGAECHTRLPHSMALDTRRVPRESSIAPILQKTNKQKTRGRSVPAPRGEQVGSRVQPRG